MSKPTTPPTSYQPRPDTFPARVLEWFRANPDEELTREDAGRKWDLAPSQVTIGLRACVIAGLLAYGHNDDLTMVYSLPRPGKKTAATSAPAPAPRPQAAAWPAAGTAPGVLDFSDIEIERDVPLPDRPAGRISKWQALFDRLTEPDTSVRIPIEWRTGVAGHASKLNLATKKAGTGPRYLVRVVDAAHARLWRLA